MTGGAAQPVLRATLENVARAAGVSLATVDRVEVGEGRGAERIRVEMDDYEVPKRRSR